MTTTITFFNPGLPVEAYGDSAINGYVKGQKLFITNATKALGLPLIATAIAGAMAECIVGGQA